MAANPRGGGRRTRAQIEAAERSATEQQSRIDRLSDYGLDLKDELRFKRHGKGNWKYAKALYVNDDDSITVLYEGRLGALPASILEKKEVGPRGGERWTPVAERV